MNFYLFLIFISMVKMDYFSNLNFSHLSSAKFHNLVSVNDLLNNVAFLVFLLSLTIMVLIQYLLNSFLVIRSFFELNLTRIFYLRLDVILAFVEALILLYDLILLNIERLSVDKHLKLQMKITLPCHLL